MFNLSKIAPSVLKYTQVTLALLYGRAGNFQSHVLNSRTTPIALKKNTIVGLSFLILSGYQNKATQ